MGSNDSPALFLYPFYPSPPLAFPFNLLLYPCTFLDNHLSLWCSTFFLFQLLLLLGCEHSFPLGCGCLSSNFSIHAYETFALWWIPSSSPNISSATSQWLSLEKCGHPSTVSLWFPKWRTQQYIHFNIPNIIFNNFFGILIKKNISANFINKLHRLIHKI